MSLKSFVSVAAYTLGAFSEQVPLSQVAVAAGLMVILARELH